MSLTLPVALFVLVFALPMVTVVATSFAEWSFLGMRWTGLENYRRLANDAAFRRAVQNTLVFAIGTLAIQLPLSVIAGIVLSWRMRGWQVLRAVLFLPLMLSGTVIALVYGMFYNPSFGLFNAVLGAVGLDTRRDWLFGLDTALPSVMATYVFVVGFGMVLVMAEIVSIPSELYEAAAVDGATRLQRELRVTLPLIRPVVGTAALLGVLASLRLFDVVFILTKGGPADRTTTFGVYGYSRYVADEWGYANSVGTVALLVGAAVIVVVSRVFRIGRRDPE